MINYKLLFIMLPINKISTIENLINDRCGWCGTDELYINYHDNEWTKSH